MMVTILFRQNVSVPNKITILLSLFFVSLVLQAAEPETRTTLSNQWNGLTSSWEDKGVVMELTYSADYFKNTKGGIDKKGEYLDNKDLTLEFDAKKLLNLDGAIFFLYIIGNQGGSPSDHAGDAQGVSNIDAPDTWKVYELWYEQSFSSTSISTKFGLYDLNSEFDSIETASLFINSSFGMGPDYSQSGQNGPSIFPSTSVALRLHAQPGQNVYVQTAVLDGVPGDPNNEKGTHVKIASGDGLLYSLEAGYLQVADESSSQPYAKFGIGGWYYSEKAADLVDTDGSGNPVYRNDYGFYVLGEYTVFQEQSDQGLSVFGRYGIANNDVYQIASYLGAGMVYTGLLPGRDKDQLGLAIAIARNSDKYRQLQSNS